MIFQGHQYETVSGFVCETFGYIPEEGGKIIVVLEKANQEEESENAETSPDNQDEERHQTFELEVRLGYFVEQILYSSCSLKSQ